MGAGRPQLGANVRVSGLRTWTGIVARMMHLGEDFPDLDERHRRLDVAAIGRRVLPDCRYETIWRGVGYVLVGTVPHNS